MSTNSKDKSLQDEVWSVNRAREFYSISVWSEGYFDVNTAGRVVAKPNDSTSIDLFDVGEKIKQQGLSYPVLVRFPQILQARIKEINLAFEQVAESQNCQLKHIPCYPIKVNQQRTVIEHILASDCEHVGLEVGSKTELLVALGLIDSGYLKLICNGYKDRAYIRIALYAQSMGVDVFIVIENPSELSIVKQESEHLGLTPKLGLRLKLNSIAAGKWQNSGGKDAKFGLDTKDILYCLEKLQQWNCRDWLTLIHFHMGSQISSLNEFSIGLQEAMAVYGETIKQGFDLKYIDVGGGLAIDYASQHDGSYFSRSYTIIEYAEIIVKTIIGYCKKYQLTTPVVITENGRAITAHHAMLMTNIVKVRDHEQHQYNYSVSPSDCQELYKMGELLEKNIQENAQNVEHQKSIFESTLQAKFLQGQISLQQRAWAENILQNSETSDKFLNKDLSHNPLVATEKYYCNFSIFQSMPDVWGLEQIFPISPLARLGEQPTKQVRLHDLTCDSDGQIAHYAFDNVIHDYLTLHELSHEEEYLLGFFLLGAYQEVLGDMHNLFGDTHTLNVEQDGQGQLQFTEIEIGDCVNELLGSIHLQGDQILQRCEQRLSQLHATNVPAEEILEEINNALYGYTYLDSVDRPVHRIKR